MSECEGERKGWVGEWEGVWEGVSECERECEGGWVSVSGIKET